MPRLLSLTENTQRTATFELRKLKGFLSCIACGMGCALRSIGSIGGAMRETIAKPTVMRKHQFIVFETNKQTLASV